jgi:sigma-B regulation protein RsbU (phosphoserine phosphatase)
VSVRAKLFLLLLALSVVPIALLRLNGQHARKLLADDLVHRSQHLLVAKAKAHMRLMVEDHAELWQREGRLLEQTLKLQALEVEKAVAGKTPLELAGAYVYAAQPPEIRVQGQITVYEDGTSTSSVPSSPASGPASGGQSARPSASQGGQPRMIHRFDGREALWYRLAMREQGMVWTAPVIDPVTRRVGLTLSMPVKDPAGRPVGVTALSAPIDMGGPAREHSMDVSERTKTYLVDYRDPDAQAKGLRIIGQAGPEGDEDEGAPGVGHHMGMMGVSTPRWLAPDEPSELALVLEDLGRGLSEVRQAEMGGKDCIWAYAPSGVRGLALVLVAPKSDVIIDATLASQYIAARFAEQWRATLYIFLAGVVVVTAAAWLVSRSVTRPIVELSRAAVRLGEGDFEARVTPSGGRELSELGGAFNQMAPRLKDHTRLTAAMALAKEVHHRLIPAGLPDIPGLDMAAVSISCEEVGGDSFDVIPGAHGDPGVTAMLVGDVSGHGLDAALLMATARAFLRMGAGQPGDASEMVVGVNRLLCLDTAGSGRFMTLFYLEAAPGRGQMRWVRAGHDPAILYCPARDAFEELTGSGIPLGVVEDRQFQVSSRAWLEPGEVLLIGSDGLWEARGPDGFMFGKDRVRETLRRTGGLSAKEVLDALLKELDRFKQGLPAEDDVTLLVLKAAPKEDA